MLGEVFVRGAAVPPPPAADRNLLFGILALQMDFVSRDALLAAMHAWVLDKGKPLGQILVEQQALRPEKRALLEALVQAHLEMHGNDPERSLAAVSSIRSIRQDLQQIADPDVQASLIHVSAARPAPDPDATRADLPSPAARRFQILRPHAKGGLGKVYVARDEELRREVALKEIQERHADSPESRARFLLEAEVTGNLEHPGIVPVYSLGHYGDGRPFYAMRFIRGDSLKDAIERFHKERTTLSPGEQGLALRQLLGRFVDVCQAIAYAHSRGVLHRDLKPGNVMLGKYGETLVVDWGLAKVLGTADVETTEGVLASSDDSALTQAGKALGTPAYMSPEQASGRLDHLGPRSDVYSLGATFYCLLTGRAPFTETDAGEVLGKVQRGDFPPPSQVNRHVTPALEAVCLKAMARKPEDRYATPRELAGEIEHWLADEPVTAYRERLGTRLLRWTRKHKALVGTSCAAGGMLLTVAVAWALVKSAEDREQHAQGLRAQAEAQHQVAEEERGEAEKQRGLVRRLLYGSHINLAQRAWEEAQIGRLDELLQDQRPENTGADDFRGFEWHYLRRLRHSNHRTLNGHTDLVHSVSFSPDGERLASGGTDRTVRVWDTATWHLRLNLKGHANAVWCVTFSGDGKRLASASFDKTVKVWDAASGQEALTLKGHTKPVCCVCWSSDGKRLASASHDNTVKVWDAATGKEIRTLTGHALSVLGLAFSPDGTRLASAGGDRLVKVWNVATGKEELTLRGHVWNVSAVAFSPDGNRLVSAAADNTVKLWDMTTGREILCFKGHNRSVRSAIFSPDGQYVASAGDDEVVRIWDTTAGQERFSYRGHTNIIWGLSFSADGKQLASASYDHTIKVWDTQRRQENARSTKAHAGYAFGVAFSPDGKRIATAGVIFDSVTLRVGGSEVNLWHAGTGHQELHIDVPGAFVNATSVAFSPDGRRLVSGTGDGQVHVWDARTRQHIFALKGYSGGDNSVAFSPDGRLIASSRPSAYSRDRAYPAGEVKVWNADSGQEVLTLGGDSGTGTGLAFSPDSKRIAGGSMDKTVKVWDILSGQEIYNLRGDSDSRCVAWSHDGRQIASGSDGGTIELWDARTGKPMQSIKAHTNSVLSLAFSPDSRRIASGGYDETVRISDPVVGQQLLSLHGHTGRVPCVAFSPDGRLLASVDHEGTLKIWDATPLPDASPPPGDGLPP
jgi:WD40 repeat protein/tRNA A-37 threonylcarbamoyl transferase component Bud32